MKSFAPACVLLLLISLSHDATAQHPFELSAGYYIVVGAYAPTRENVAKNYTELLTRRGYSAGYGFDSNRKHFYVFLKYFQSLRESVIDMQNTRKEAEFSRAWVRVIPGEITKTDIPVSKAVDAAPDSENSEPEPASPEPPAVGSNETPVRLTSASEAPKEAVAEAQAPTSGEEIEITDNPPIEQFAKMTLGNTEAFLSLFNAANHRIVEGEVTVVDAETDKVIKKVKGNDYLMLPDPKNSSGKLRLICEAFGYRKVQLEMNYKNPLPDTVHQHVELMGTTFVVFFDLIRYHRGDIVTLYNVYFYNDAAVMLPESKFEVNSLVQMMEENPHYRIRLHGHTNGNYHGKIITMGENKNFFSIDGSKNSIGSAKDLSYNRAEVIKEYLVASGIDANRVDVKAWGGRKPIYDKHSVNAKRNVRVEVEILDE